MKVTRPHVKQSSNKPHHTPSLSFPGPAGEDLVVLCHDREHDVSSQQQLAVSSSLPIQPTPLRALLARAPAAA
jgi:hypothetical protein